MKKLLVAFVSLFMGAVLSGAVEPVDFSVGFDNPIPMTPGHGKSPIEVPDAMLDGHQLTFLSAHADFTLYLFDGTGNVVYSVYVPSATTQVVLPATLSGDYELRLLPDNSNYYFYTYIYL